MWNYHFQEIWENSKNTVCGLTGISLRSLLYELWEKLWFLENLMRSVYMVLNKFCEMLLCLSFSLRFLLYRLQRKLSLPENFITFQEHGMWLDRDFITVSSIWTMREIMISGKFDEICLYGFEQILWNVVVSEFFITVPFI